MDTAVSQAVLDPAPLARHWREELRPLARITSPLAASFLAEMAMNFTDTVIVGRLGSLELAAVGLAGNLLATGIVVFMGLLGVVGIFAAHSHGAGDPEGVSRSVRHGLWLALALSIPVTWAGLDPVPWLRILGQKEEVVQMAAPYLQTAVWSFLPYMWFTVLRSFVAALSRPRSVMVITVGAVALNGVLVYFLVFGAFGLPGYGVAGAGAGTAITCWVMLLALGVHIRRSPAFRHYGVLSALTSLDRRYMAEMLRVGLPIGGVQAIEMGMFTVITVLMGVLGATVLAAHQVAAGFANILFMVPLSISQAASIRVAHGMGAGQPSAARLAGLVAMVVAVIYMTLAALLMWTFPEAIVSIYLDTDNPANAPVLDLAAVLLAVAAVFQVVDAIQVVAAGALRGIKDTAIPLLVAVVGYWGVGLGSGLLLTFHWDYGGPGLWWGAAFGLAVAAALLSWRFFVRVDALVRALPAGAGPR